MRGLLHRDLRHTGQAADPSCVKAPHRRRRTPPDARESTDPAARARVRRDRAAHRASHERRRGDAGGPEHGARVEPLADPSHTPCASTPVTVVFSRTSTRRRVNASRAALRSFSGNDARIVGPASTRTMRAATSYRWIGIRREASAARSRPAFRPARRRLALHRPARTSAAPAAAPDRSRARHARRPAAHDDESRAHLPAFSVRARMAPTRGVRNTCGSHRSRR